MTTFITGRLARPIGEETFADLTDATLVAIRTDGIEFDEDLDEDTREAIRRRMTSTDLATLCAAVGEDPSLENLAAAVQALCKHILGE